MNITANYTHPTLNKGPKPKNLKGTALANKWAKNVWYINYSYNGKQYRIKRDINRVKDPSTKLYNAEVLLQSIINDLKAGYNPEAPEAYLQHYKSQHITLKQAVDFYILDINNYLRKKSVESYHSKLRFLLDAYPDIELQDLSVTQIQNFINTKIKGGENARMHIKEKIVVLEKITRWSPKTVRNARRIFTTFFNWCIAKKYASSNPVLAIDWKRVRSENEVPKKHIPFSCEDAQAILRYLDAHDKFTAFFCRVIYYTCLRPSEIVKLQLRDINMDQRKITVRLSVMKNTKKTESEYLDIEPNLHKELTKIGISDKPKDWYLTSDGFDICGPIEIRRDKAYKAFVKVVNILGLTGKGYTLYGFKHYSNVQRYKDGWTVTEIMKANRHSSISMTEVYLKNLSDTTDISHKAVPRI